MRTAVKTLLLAAALGAAVATAPVHAGDDDSCKTVRFADVGWSDVAATTGLASVVLEGLGYKPTLTIASVPIAFAGMKNKQIDVFLGYWKPTMTPVIEPFVMAGQIQVLPTPNLLGAKYTLAVPRNLYDKGLKSFADIAKFKKKLNGKIYGIEPGNAGNALILDMIKNNEIALVINTVEERRNAIADSRQIRTSALLARVTTYTTIAGAEAAVEGMKCLDNLTVYSLQELHAQLG